MPASVLGVVLEVRRSDDPANVTSFQRTDARGYMHSATVLVMMDEGAGAYLRLEHVTICPSIPSGIDGYSEHLPRPCTGTVDGTQFNGRLSGVNPYDLDGDWCVVSFIGGSIRHPYITSWWPHPRNVFDAQTSGEGNPNQRGQGQALDQMGRILQRVNGVETVVTSKGDVYFSTTWANSSVTLGETEATQGRFHRQEHDVGGTVVLNIKPSQNLIIDFNPEIEGGHFASGFEDDLPQTNPRTRRSAQSRATTDTSLVMTKSAFRFKTKETASVISTEDVILTGGETVQISTDAATIDADTSVEIESPSIKLGTTAPEKLIKGETYEASTGALVDVFQAALGGLTTAITAATTTTDLGVATKAAIDALALLIQQLQAQIEPALTTKTKAE